MKCVKLNVQIVNFVNIFQVEIIQIVGMNSLLFPADQIVAKMKEGGHGPMIQNIINEMVKGNFSFAILVVGILQLIVMIKNGRKKKNEHRQKDKTR